MASYSLYPPVIDATVPAFVASGDSATCRLYFSLSRFSSSVSAIKSVHISVLKQSSGQSVVRKVDNPSLGRYRSSGIIIINSAPVPADEQNNLYYIDILNEDISAGDSIGWCPGWIYKMQVRLSTVAYSGTIGQAAWLTANGNNFSEWSTYCTSKAISQPRISIPILKNFDSGIESADSNKDKTYSISSTSLNFSGTYSNKDTSETLYSYSIRCYDIDYNLIEDSGVQYPNQYQNTNQFSYLFKKEFVTGIDYILELEYMTINQYTEKYDFMVEINNASAKNTTIRVVTIDSIDAINNEEYVSEFKGLTSKEIENEDGRIGFKLYGPNVSNNYNGNLCVRRSSSKDNFETWTDIKMIVCVNQMINSLPMYYDNTVENGVWYKYGIEIVETDGTRGILNYVDTPIIRNFEYSILIGEGGKQLRLMYDNTMTSYAYTKAESKNDPIGGQYPIITRNGATNYRTFPLNGLISYNMDETGLFETDKTLYKYDKVIDRYVQHRLDEDFSLYDYKKEFDFRESVLKFLQDGRPKLFKSPTEGNVIVQLMQVTGQPNQSLDRMIYSFTSTAYEIAEATMENYEKYGYFKSGSNDYLTSFVDYKTNIGQLDMSFSVGDNIIDKIMERYDHSTQNIAGTRFSLKGVHHLTIDFVDAPLRVRTSAGEGVLGNNFSYNGNIITVRSDYIRSYYFDENVTLNGGDKLIILGDVNGEVTTVHALVNFLYDQTIEPYTEKKIDTRTSTKGIGQLFGTYEPGANIYRELYYKFYYEWEMSFRRLREVTWTTIEANPGAVFLIQDLSDNDTTSPQEMYHEINRTGILRFDEANSLQGLKYIGMRKPDGSIDTTVSCDVMIDYIYYATEGTYEEG